MKYIPLLLVGALLAACNSSTTVNVEAELAPGVTVDVEVDIDDLFFTNVNHSNDIPFSDVSINGATFSGSGCPAGSGDMIVSPDKKSISVLLDEYIVDAGDGAGLVNRSKCDIAISLDIPQGYRAVLMDADYRLAVDLTQDSLAEFTRQYFFAGGESETFKDSWSGTLENLEVELPDRLGAYGGSLSECGEDVIFRSKTSLYASVPHDGETAFIAVDSLDFKSSAQFDYTLDYVACD
jgi:hypothetical protein